MSGLLSRCPDGSAHARPTTSQQQQQQRCNTYTRTMYCVSCPTFYTSCTAVKVKAVERPEDLRRGCDARATCDSYLRCSAKSATALGCVGALCFATAISAQQVDGRRGTAPARPKRFRPSGATTAAYAYAYRTCADRYRVRIVSFGLSYPNRLWTVSPHSRTHSYNNNAGTFQKNTQTKRKCNDPKKFQQAVCK